MSEFEVKTYPVIIERHPDADLLELARIGDYYSIVLKGQFQTGDTCAYIPEASVIPDNLIAKMGLEGKLAGRAHNRVKAIKLRGVLSQGLVYPCQTIRREWTWRKFWALPSGNHPYRQT